MTTPEERAKEVVRSLCEPLDGSKPYLETPIRKTMAEVIASAIRSAENDKMEWAAQLCERLETHFDALPQPEAALISGALDELSNRLRSLKSQ
ncbi:hypothetical protein [Bosea sp. AS-1]|uniref:hypothetical protein n=1 Tax=Bosea sp. AS-1 TaxID=2015316 RepID=UPI000B772542|nr:hypothetical protein [Bosea sp. AS-1]